MAGILGFKPLNAAKSFNLQLNSPITILEGRQGGFIFATTTALMAGALFRVPAYGTTDADLVWGDTAVFNSSAIHIYRTGEAVFIDNKKYPNGITFQLTVIGY